MKYVMRILFLAAISASLHLSAAAPEVSATVSPSSVAAGELVTFSLKLDRRLTEGLRLPPLENGQWITNSVSQRMESINFNTSYTYEIPIRAEREGTLKIPSFSFRLDGQEVTTRALEVKVLPPGSQPAVQSSGDSVTMKEAAFGTIRIPEKRRTFFVGEEIPLELNLWLLPSLRARLAEYPELSGLDNVVFRDYSRNNPQMRRFDRPAERRELLDGRYYGVLSFRTAFRATVPGKLTPGASATVSIVRNDGRRARRPRSPFDDDFFDSFFSRENRVPYRVTFEPGPEITIKALPPAPANCINLGLVGDWEISCRFDQNSGKVGEPLSLSITARGEGTPETFATPKLELPGFRVYPGEVKKSSPDNSSLVELKYAVIPLEPGEKNISLKFATFRPATGEYVRHDFDLKLPIVKSERKLSAAVSDSAPAAETARATVSEPEVEKIPAPREELFYLKAAPGSGVALPLIRNRIGWILLFLLGGPLAAILIEWRCRRRERLEHDPEFARRTALRKKLPQLLRQLRGDGDVAPVLREEAVPYLAEALHLPPGAGAAEVARKLDDPELAGLFDSLEAESFKPVGGERSPVVLTQKLRSRLVNLLKRVSLFALSILALTAVAAQVSSTFNAAFEKGDFKAAAAGYEKQLNPAAPAPNVLYNLASAHYRLGDLPRARLGFEQAHLLAPRDSETLENLNLVNRKLVLPEIGTAGTPKALLTWCRDRLRPDDYLTIAAAMFAVLCLTFGLRRTLRRNTLIVVESVATVLLMLSLAAATAQAVGPYNPDQAIIIGSTLELRTLPTAASGRVEATIPGGSTAFVVERRGDWVRLRVNGRDGWAPADQVKLIFPGGILY